MPVEIKLPANQWCFELGWTFLHLVLEDICRCNWLLALWNKSPWGAVPCPWLLLSAALLAHGRGEECYPPPEKQRSHWLYLLIARRAVKCILQGDLAMFLTEPDKQIILLFLQDMPKGERKSSSVWEWFWDYSSALTRGKKNLSHSTSA